MPGYHRIIGFLFILLLCSGSYARTSAPLEAKAEILEPEDGANLVGPVHIKMKVERLEVVPAGLAKAGTGHFVLLVDVDGVPLFDRPLPGVKPYYNYSGGQSEAKLGLEPGIHSLQLVMVDHEHRPHSPPVVSKKIHIRVLGPEIWKTVVEDKPTTPVEPTVQAKPTTAPAEPTVQAKPATAPVEPTVQAKPATVPAEPTVQAKPATAPAEPTVQAKPATAPVEPMVQAKPATAPVEPMMQAKPVTVPAELTAAQVDPVVQAQPAAPADPGASPTQGPAQGANRALPWNRRGGVPGYSYGMGR